MLQGAGSKARFHFLAAHAPHLALQALHLDMVLAEPHLAPHARQTMAQPPRAAVVTTAAARLRDRRDESVDMMVSSPVGLRRQGLAHGGGRMHKPW